MADLPDGFFNLKHRLVGATVLILAAVILLPRVLTGPATEPARSNVNERTAPQIQSQVLSVVAPSESDLPEVSTRTRIEIIEQPGAARMGDQTESAQSSDVGATERIDDRSVEIPRSSDLSVSKPIVTGFIVQVGIFQRPENARNLISNLKKDGIDAKAETIAMDGRQATLIWLGPFSTRSDATREGSKAMMRTKNKPIVKEWP